METVGALLGSLSFIAFAVLAILFFVPRFRARRRAIGWGLAGAFAAFVVALVITPTPPAARTGAVTAQPSPAAAASATRRVTTSGPSTQAPPQHGIATIRAMFLKHYATFKSDTQLCDDAVLTVMRLAPVVETDTVSDLEDDIRDGVKLCTAAGVDVSRLVAVEGVPESARMQQTIKYCAKAYDLQADTMRITQEAVEGRKGARGREALEDTIGRGNAGLTLCGAGWRRAADSIGVKLPS